MSYIAVSLHLNSVQDGVYVFRQAHMRSAPSLRVSLVLSNSVTIARSGWRWRFLVLWLADLGNLYITLPEAQVALQ